MLGAAVAAVAVADAAAAATAAAAVVVSVSDRDTVPDALALSCAHLNNYNVKKIYIHTYAPYTRAVAENAAVWYSSIYNGRLVLFIQKLY